MSKRKTLRARTSLTFTLSCYHRFVFIFHKCAECCFNLSCSIDSLVPKIQRLTFLGEDISIGTRIYDL